MKKTSSPDDFRRALAAKSAIPVLLTLAVSCAHGALVLQTQINPGTAPSVFQPLAGDLLETSVVSFAGENAEALVRNGAIVGAFGDDTAGSFPAKVWGQIVTTYDFNLTTNPLGYNITMIQAYSAWNDRASQSYQIFYAQVGSPSTFLQLGGDIIATNAGGSIITRSEDSVADTAILNNVSSIRFVQIDGSIQLDGIETVFRELDVVGFASVPEPSTSVLGLGSAILLFYRRRS